MTDAQREALGLVYEVLGCPFPAAGTQSVSIKGLASYADDMRKLVPLCRRIVFTVACGQDYRGQLRDACDDLRKAYQRISGKAGM